ncbi:MAG: sigma-70 family RNA polymerase sigma factor [Planctomycetota bacterium]
MSTLDPDLIQKHAAFLRSLARGLLRDPHDADDVVQETWTVAMEKPPRHAGNVRGWLRVVARNLALRVRRGRRRRDGWERAASRPDRLPSAAELAERAELQKKVLEALGALEEPYRATIQYRYFDDLGPKEIAEHQGLPVKTVKTRLSRGLAKLRARLDEAHGGDRRAWALVLLPLAFPRPAPQGAPTGGGGLVTGGTLIVLKKTLLVAAAVLVAALIALEQFDEDRAPPAPPEPYAEEVAPSSIVADLPTGQTEEPGGQPESGPAPRAGPIEGKDLPEGAWKVTVLGPEDVPLEGVRVHARGNQGYVVTGRDGSVALPWEPVDGKLTVWTSGLVPTRYFRIIRPDSTLRFRHLIPLTAEVLDGESGAPIRNAALSLVARGARVTPMDRVGDGYRLDTSPLSPGQKESLELAVDLPQGFVLCRRRSWKVSGTVSRFAESVHVTVVAWPEAPVRLKVEEADGGPAAGTTVEMISSSLGLGLAYRAAPTGSGGETRVRGLPCIPGESVVLYVVKDGRRACSTLGRIGRSGEEVLLTAVLPAEAPSASPFNSVIGIGGGAGGAFGGRGGRHRVDPTTLARLVVLVTRRSGAPAKGALVVVSGEGRTERRSRTDDTGRATFPDLLPGEVAVAVQEPGFLMGRPVAVRLSSGVSESVEILEARGTFLHLQVLTDEGLPARFAELTVSASGKVPFTHLVDGVQRLNFFTDLDGMAVLPHLPAGKVKVTARLGSRKATAAVGPGGYLVIGLPRAK